MNIKEAKEQIKNALTAYFTKDDTGRFIIPIEKQRPVFLMGPPGIGKTAIMEQIAQELGVGLISYSMTHHTRQSALGLPFIVHKNYYGVECDVSEYTMSEIISSVYDMMQDTGIKEGILFLDEINCVSETLAPVMLQFLQYKIFGRHKVPDGWIVVTAGNPPEYNNSVREFDIVTWDRLKRIDVEPDFEVWKEYAYKKGVHPAIITYLEIKKSDFYIIQSVVGGKQFVTARGWDDLSMMIYLYEQNNIPVDAKLITQYIQCPQVTDEFAVYYDLFNKYRSDYQIPKILSGNYAKSIVDRIQAANFDEKLSVLGLLLDAINTEVKTALEKESVVISLLSILKKLKPKILSGGNAKDLLAKEIEELNRNLENAKTSSSISNDEQRTMILTIKALKSQEHLVSFPSADSNPFEIIREDYNKRRDSMKDFVSETSKKLENAFLFCETAFGDGQEMLILVTELTISYYCSEFIGKYGCEKYFSHSKELMFYERQQEIIEQLNKYNL